MPTWDFETSFGVDQIKSKTWVLRVVVFVVVVVVVVVNICFVSRRLMSDRYQ